MKDLPTALELAEAYLDGDHVACKRMATELVEDADRREEERKRMAEHADRVAKERQEHERKLAEYVDKYIEPVKAVIMQSCRHLSSSRMRFAISDAGGGLISSGHNKTAPRTRLP